jgi:hypothetical protein
VKEKEGIKICKGLWKCSNPMWFVLITKKVSRHIWEGKFYNNEGTYMGNGKWNDQGNFYMIGMDMYRLDERRRGEEGGWPNVPQM